MESIASLVNPKAIAVVGASPQSGRGRIVLANLKEAEFGGEVFAVNPKYEEVHGYRCYPSVSALPAGVDCIAVAVAADAACKVLEDAFAHDIRAAVVLSSGFGEGGHGEDRAQRLLALAGKGMSICGPNCFGLHNVRTGAAVFSGALSPNRRPGSVVLISQSGGLGTNAFMPLINDRQLGFSHLISCGNQVGTTIEDYIEHFIDDQAVTVIAVVVESLKNPAKLQEVARLAHAKGKVLLFYRPGRSAAGQTMVRSHTGALTGNAEIFKAFLRRCGVVQIDSYDQFVEAIELFATAPRDDALDPEVIVISGSGGGAATAADALDDCGMKLAKLNSATEQAIKAQMPEFGSVSNPLDGTGAIYDNAELLPKLFAALLANPGRPVIAAAIIAAGGPNAYMRRIAKVIAESAVSSGRTMLAFQPTPLGGPLDAEIVTTLHAANVPLLLGVSSAMGALRYLSVQRQYRERSLSQDAPNAAPDGFSRAETSTEAIGWDFLSARQALHRAGVPVTEAGLAESESEAVSIFRKFQTPVVVKAEVEGLLHKSDIGCVVVNCGSDDEVGTAYRAVIGNARNAGFQNAQAALIQPMASGVAEVFAGVINDPLFGPAVTFGLGGIFVEIVKDATTEMAPISLETARRMIEQIKGARILNGARGRKRADIEALAELLVCLGQFAAANCRRFRALDLNPIIVRPEGEGVVAVDIAVERHETK